MVHWTLPTPDGQFEVELPEGWHCIREDHFRKLKAAATFLSDLDRSEAGRHKGDTESQDPSGISRGNPFLTEGQRIGTTLSGTPIYYPYFERADLSDVSLWNGDQNG